MNVVTSKDDIPEEQLQGGAVTASGVTHSGMLPMVVTASGVPSPFQDRAMRSGYPEGREVAYVITDPNFGAFEVYESANAWWMDRVKVNNLIKAFKAGYSIKNARYFAGISEEQWKYFVAVHPHFYPVKDACEGLIEMKARDIINNDIVRNENVNSAFRYLKEIRGVGPGDKSKLTVNVGEGGQAVVNQQNIENNIDDDKVTKILSRVISEVESGQPSK
jgi:hypothetical protein